MLSPPRMESDLERRRRMSYVVEAFIFVEPFQYTYDLVWNRLENTLVIAYEEIWSKVHKWAMCAILTKEVPRIKNIELMPKFVKRLFIKRLGKDIG
jgi:hypothetical protein